jgi:phosphoglycerate dehydrogenase-like enzyme
MRVTPDQVAGADGLIVLRPRVGADALERGRADLVAIGRSGAGYDKIDVAACTANDVVLFNAPDALTHPTASAALLLMLALAKRLPWQEGVARSGGWERQGEVTGSEIQGRTLGIIGLGRTGRELARLVAPFAMRVLAYSPHADPLEAAALGVTLVSLEELLKKSDFVSLHCRLDERTRHILGADQFALMKPSAVLVNVARGENVDQAALVEALRTRRIAGAGLDVFSPEPPLPDDPILSLDNVIVTPHWLASTSDVWEATGRVTAEGMLRVAQGLVPEDVVNPEVLTRPGFVAKLERFAENREL